MPEGTPQENISGGTNLFSPLPQPSEPVVAKEPSGKSQSKKTLIIGATLVVLMLVLVGVTFYSLRSGSSSNSTPTLPTPPPSASAQPLTDQSLDQSVSQVNGDFSNIDNEVNGVNSGLNDRSPDLTY